MGDGAPPERPGARPSAAGPGVSDVSDVAPVTILDQISVWAAAIPIASLFAIPVSVAPTFTRMFADMGAPLPVLTQWVLAGWLPVLLAVLPSVLLAHALLAARRLTRMRRRLVIAASFFVGVIGIVICLAALYRPVFDRSVQAVP